MPEVDARLQSPDGRRRPQPEDGPLRIVHEDPWVLVLDKPAGTVVHPTYKNTSGTLLNAVLWRVRDHPGAQPGILTRLDKNTSGLVVVGLTAAVHAAMQKDGAAGRIRKEYLAVVAGVPDPPAGSITLALGRDVEDRRRVVVTPTGARCETRYVVVSDHGGRSLVRCELVTGRTHQIRVHMATSGWPIVGDSTYGDADPGIGRQALHAWRIALPHPVTRESLDLHAPVPDDIRRLLPAQVTDSMDGP